MCEYDSTWDTESDGDDPAGESQSRRSNQDKNKSSWAIVSAFIAGLLSFNAQKPCLAIIHFRLGTYASGKANVS